jgi:hypothetical protein
MVGAQHPLAVGERPLKQRDRLGQRSRREKWEPGAGQTEMAILFRVLVEEDGAIVLSGRPGITYRLELISGPDASCRSLRY